MENTRFKIFIVSIERNKKRYTSLLKKIEEQGFDLSNVEVFIGIDYHKDRIPPKIVSKWGRYSPKSVLACAASHILLWEYISKQDIDFALILEDDAYVIKEKFDSYFNDFKRIVNDHTFLNLSTAFTITSKQKNDDLLFEKNIQEKLFSESSIVLSLEAYMLTPGLCKKLFEFYKTHGLSYHIDLHLTFIKDYIPMNLVHFNKKITEGNMRIESSMVQKHDKKFILRLLQGTETYKELNTPIVEYQGIVLTAYTIIVFVLFILAVAITFLTISKKHDLSIFMFIFLSLMWLVWGFFLYDAL
ncbi:putative IMV heparin binding surface protein [Yalta virus]|nr:putative IMV heparin binding surface protein [Yalta virus]